MKKVILAFLAIVLVNFNLFAQDLEQDITYYKLVNKLWTMSSSFDKVAFHLDNQSVELEQSRLTELEVIEKLYKEASDELNDLKSKNYNSLTFKKVERMLEAMEQSMIDLKSEKWASDPMWQYGYSLTKMNLTDLGTQKESSQHLSKNEK